MTPTIAPLENSTVSNQRVSVRTILKPFTRRCFSEPNIAKLDENQPISRWKSFPCLASKQNQIKKEPLFEICSPTEKRPPVSVISYGQPQQLSRIVAPKATFVEMTHAEFMKRQLLLNEKVNIRQGFRVGNQIFCMPDLLSCSTSKNNAPILVQSSIQQARNVPNVVVSQTSTSHTIHYTPTLTHAQPNWQQEIRKKPIIAYARRKINEKEPAKENVISLGSESLTHSKMISKVLENGNSSDDEVVFIKTTDRRQYSTGKQDIPTVPKQTLPKFNQTFVHNYQVRL